MPAYATRLDRTLERVLVRLARRGLSPAEITREVGALAEVRGIPRPSYSRVRQISLDHRPLRRVPEPSWGSLVLDVALRNKHPDVLIQKATGTLPMDEDAGL